MTSLTGLLGSFTKFLMRVLLYPTPQGALTQLWAGTSPDSASLNGEVSTSSSPTTNETHVVRRSILSRGRGLANLAATTQTLGESFGLGSKSRLRIYRKSLTIVLVDPDVFYTLLPVASYFCPGKRKRQREWSSPKRNRCNKLYI